MTYEITEWPRYRNGYGTAFKILEFYGQNDQRNRFTNGLFHTQEQAQAWIDQRAAKLQAGRAASRDNAVLTISDYYSANERIIREINA